MNDPEPRVSQSLAEKITTETLRRIASNDEYEDAEILCVAEYLANLYEYDFEAQFGLIGRQEGNAALSKLEKLDVREQPFFAVCCRGLKHWVCLAVTHLHGCAVVLYKDSFGVPPSNSLREAIHAKLPGEKVRFECHRGTEQSDDSSSGPICLRNLQVLMKGIKSPQIKVPLIEKFQKVRFCTQYGVLSVKREFRLWLQKHLLSGLEDVTADLVADPAYNDFRESLGSFLDGCVKLLKESFVVSSTYTSLLKTEAKKKDQDVKYETDHKSLKALKNARTSFYSNSEVQKSVKINKNEFIDLDGGNRVYNLEIQERFPLQMQKFTKIFAVLAQAEMNEELDKAFRMVSEKLTLDYDKIKIFFELHKPPKRPDFMRADFAPPNIVAVVEKAVEAVKAKTKATKVKNDSGDKKIKDWDRLLTELVLDAHGVEANSEEVCAAQARRIRECLPLIERYRSEWSGRSVTEINQFASARRAEERAFEMERLCEAIAVMDRANELATSGHRLRAPQILSILVFLSSAADRGKLCQIESGEGKTVIVSLLATIMILQGEKTVDVITSNAVLAQEGVDSRKLFYTMFNISVASNVPDKTYAQGPRKCYVADVVYGSINDFQFDYLRDTAEGLGTMSGRQFARVILDEVDNMLVDNGRHIAKISSPFPGMENLKYIYLRIWSELLNVESDLIDDFQDKLNDFSDIKKAKEMAVREFIKIFDASMVGRMEERMKVNLQDVDMKFVPTHCLKYAENMIPKWISNAIRARYFINENEQYSLKEVNGELTIVPVDYSNTGVTLKNTVWSYGLHQFVQIKHNVRITPESLTSSCVSNYAFIGKYGHRIFGLTGTLGSRAEQDLLSSIYNVDYARVPTYRSKSFKELKGVIVPDDSWCYEVTLMTIGLVRNTGRAVLIICKTIADLMRLEEQFGTIKSQACWDCKIQLKKFQDEETADVTRETVTSGDVIVATNIAGRGADFKTSRELERNGGLHVLVGFCPDNERVREQAFFRTSRQGNLGSAQLVVRESEIKRLGIDTGDLDKIDFNEVNKRIDFIERERLNDIKRSKVDVLRYEDALFGMFSDMCQELKNNNVITWGHSYLMKDLKEFWAFWLEEQNFEDRQYSLKEASYVFFKFKYHDVTKKIVSGTISQNPYYGILQADFFLKNDEVEKAKNSLVNAVCLSKNPTVMYPAFIALFDSHLEEKGPLLTKFKSFLSKVFAGKLQNEEKTPNFATELVEYLLIALTGLTEEIDFMETNYFNEDSNFEFKRLLVKPTKSKENLLVKHLAAKLTSLKVYRGNVEMLLETLDGSDTHSLAVNKRIKDYLKNFTADTKEEKQTRDLMTEAELSELGSKGLKTIYGLKKLPMISDSSLEKERSKILGALSLISRAAAFPPLSFAVANIASIMVTEAIASVVLVMFKEVSNIDEALPKIEYLKGRTLNYVLSQMVSGTLNFDLCCKIFLRTLRAYRESYHLLDRSADEQRLLKSVNSTQIGQDVRAVEGSAEPASHRRRTIRVPESLGQQLFDSEVASTIVGSIVDFVVVKGPSSPLENGNGLQQQQRNQRSGFVRAARDAKAVPRIEKHLQALGPTRFGGPLDELRGQFPKSEGLIAVAALPAENCYAGTAYAGLERSRLPGLALLARDERGLRRLRIGRRQSAAERRRELLEKGEFWQVLRDEIAELLALGRFYEINKLEHASYAPGLVQMLQYCKSEELPGLPQLSTQVPQGRLISQEQYNSIVQLFKLKPS